MTGLTEVARRVTDLRSRPAPDRLAEAAALVPLLDDRVDPDSAINLWTMLAREVTGPAVATPSDVLSAYPYRHVSAVPGAKAQVTNGGPSWSRVVRVVRRRRVDGVALVSHPHVDHLPGDAGGAGHARATCTMGALRSAAATAVAHSAARATLGQTSQRTCCASARTITASSMKGASTSRTTSKLSLIHI